MNDTTHLLSTKANRERLLASIAQDKKTSQETKTKLRGKLNKVGKK